MTIEAMVDLLLRQQGHLYSIYWLICSTAQAQRAVSSVRNSTDADQHLVVYAELGAGGSALLRCLLLSLHALPRSVSVIDADLELLLQDLRCSAKDDNLSKPTIWLRFLDSGHPRAPESMESAIACLHLVTTILSKRLRFIILDNGNIKWHKRLGIVAVIDDGYRRRVLDL